MKNSNSPDQDLNEGITQLIEQASANFEDPALEGFPFQVIIATNDENQVKMTVRWPDGAPPAQSSDTISNMLHHLTEGHWKTPLIQAVHNQGQATGDPVTAMGIIQKWSETTRQMMKVASERHIKPSQVFQREGR